MGDYISANPEIAEAIELAVNVIKWFLHHSYALGIFNKEQEATYSFVLALIVPVITRWTAHFCAVCHLLKVQTAMKVTVMKHRDELVESVGNKKDTKEKAQRVLDIVQQNSFWDNLEQ